MIANARSKPNDVVDLHCHSSASDGALGLPTEIPGFFKRRGYAAFSLTEHDSLSSHDAAASAAADAGIEFIPGIELSTLIDDPEIPARRVHILGYLFHRTDALEELTEPTVGADRLRALLDILRDDGLADIEETECYDRVAETFGSPDAWKQPYHVDGLAPVLCRHGLIEEASNRAVRQFLKPYHPRLPSLKTRTLGNVVHVLRDAGAVIILAHPGHRCADPESPAERELLTYWLENYVDGLEVFTPKHSPEYEKMALELVRDRARPCTGGTDAHAYGESTPVSTATYDCVEGLRAWKDMHASATEQEQ